MTNQTICTSVVDGSEALFLKNLNEQNIIFIADDDKQMMRVVESLRFFVPEAEVISLPAWDCLPYDRISPNSSIMSRRLVALSRIASGVSGDKKNILVTTINAALQKIPAKEIISSSVLHVKSGDNISRDRLTSFLVENGYVNSGRVTEHGDYAFRGSIVDIFPPGHEVGYRLDFFGDSVETIREFNPVTQISGAHCKVLELIPASEVLLNEKTITRFRENYRDIFDSNGRDDPLYEAVSQGRKYAGIEHWLPLFYERLETIFDYLPESLIVSSGNIEEIQEERLNNVLDYYDSRLETVGGNLGAIYNPVPPESFYVLERDWREICQRGGVTITPFSRPAAENIKDVGYKQIENIAVVSHKQERGVFDLFREFVMPEKLTLVACATQGSRDRMKSMLASNDIVGSYVDDFGGTKALPKSSVGLVVFNLEHGFIADEITCFSEQDILGERIVSARRKKVDVDHFMEEASNLEEGEVVVHKEHGIGRFVGLETIEVGGTKHDCLKLVYAGDDRLFLPVENIDSITKYGSGEDSTQLDRLGGLAWQKRTSSLKKRIKVTAKELIEIAAQRFVKPADSFDSSTGPFQEFCSKFPYAETEDQLGAIEDVVNDLSSGHPMDRLICGDVGFGKTEVALRAAFLVGHGDGVNKGQVAVITPTTLLARQHALEFERRFKDFPVKVRQLSRLVSTTEAKKIHEDIADGKVDVVIGTHALLSKNINFKKLSLLIVDEEQHFGVKQKERLKKLRAQTHVLTMTATPIPRTLQLSMTGVRDLSLIATPPVDRLAIRTYVMPYDQMVTREAILREHYRGGRTFYVCPRISDLEAVEKELRELVPEVKLVVAHGQMAPGRLDEIMNEFYDGKYDVLLSTTIIESGIDIPEANTLIVHRADMFGLSQLYQLRGRVGRSNVRAYAYLTTPVRRKPTKQAMKRLEVMQTLDTLGAGFSLASYDMDIRGFGNLLGDEQSGNVREVGVELYQQMLKEAVENLKNLQEGGLEEVEQEEGFTPKINIGVSVLIPESYIQDLTLRLGLYKRIGHLKNVEDVEAMAVELVDRFGPMPDEVKHLLEVVKIKGICKQAGIERLDVGAKATVISFHNNNFSNPEALIKYISANSSNIKLKPDQSIVVSHGNWDSFDKKVNGISNSITELLNLAA